MIKDRLKRLEKHRLGENDCSLKEILLADGFISQAEHDAWPEEEPLPENVTTVEDVFQFLYKQEEYHG